MINLLPIEEKKNLRRQYNKRLTLVCMTMFLFLAIASMIALLPSYLLSIAKDKIETSRAMALKNKGELTTDPTTALLVLATNTKLDSLSMNGTSPTLAFDSIIDKKMPTIKLTDFSYQKKDKNKKGTALATISISGTASSRDSLLSFKKSLEGDTHFSGINLPVSDLVKNSNIPFTFTFDYSDTKQTIKK